MEEYVTVQGRSVIERLEKLFLDDCQTPDLSPLPPTAPQTTIISRTEAPVLSPTKGLRKVVSAAEFEKSTYQRMLHYQLKKQERLRQVQAQIQKEELAEVTCMPAINKGSMDTKHIPISERVGEIVQKKEEWRRLKAEERKAELEAAELQELTFHPKIVQKPRNRRTVEEFEIYLESTKEKKDKEIERLRQISESKLEKQLVFRPTISQRSMKIMRNKGGLSERMEDEVILSALRKEEVRKKYQPTFRPEIGRKSLEIAEKKRSRQVFERLYESKSQKNQSFHGVEGSDHTVSMTSLELIAKSFHP